MEIGLHVGKACWNVPDPIDEAERPCNNQRDLRANPSMAKYIEEIRATHVPSGSIAAWWLGQNGFLFKTPAGITLSVDAYLTDSCAPLGSKLGVNLARAVPVFIPPQEFAVDYFVCTHSHQDHADPETICSLPKDTMRFIGPGLACEVFARCGVSPERIQQLYPGGRCCLGGVTIHGTFALPTDDTDLNHIGLLIEVDGGPRVYVTGDTAYSELLAHAAKMQPDAMITCINGGFNNLNPWQAAELARLVRPRIAIPCHYDMFPDNGQDPELFRAALRCKAPDVAYRRLAHMELLLITA